MSFSIASKFHPFALLASMGIFLVIMLNLNSNTPLAEKMLFLGIAGSIYFLILTFESWRIN
ncbi:MAG: hypothetical protein JW815_04390, partial [Candidatus Bathyarchaeota archaeon]|nr:hypothetical protein [Candidatus Bathyarchaeum sp.]